MGLVSKNSIQGVAWLPCPIIPSPGKNFPSVGSGDNRAMTRLGFAHVTTKTYAYLWVYGFFRFFCNK